MTPPDREHVVRMFNYHHWAGDRVFDVVAELPAADLDKKWGGSFGTGRALLRHVVGVERLWYERWNGNSPKGVPEFSPAFAGSDFRAEWKKSQADQKRFLDGLSSDRLSSDLSYVNMKGEHWTYPLAELLTHLVNHGTYHRGQITHLLRDLGQTAPSTDYLLFAEDRRRG
jgi:uncharacterized damage-inducible protein DinB